MLASMVGLGEQMFHWAARAVSRMAGWPSGEFYRLWSTMLSRHVATDDIPRVVDGKEDGGQEQYCDKEDSFPTTHHYTLCLMFNHHGWIFTDIIFCADVWSVTSSTEFHTMYHNRNAQD